jgi:hypothetical protein
MILGCQWSPAQDFVFAVPSSKIKSLRIASAGTEFTALSLEATDVTQAIKMK